MNKIMSAIGGSASGGKKILISVSIIAAAAAIVIGATTAYFSDTETSTGNTFTAGVIDIMVDGQNPWTRTFSDELKDMKPSDTRYIVFTVKNLIDSNPVNVWKHIDIKGQTDGVVTEPECTEGGGTWNQGGNPQCGGSYVPRNNLAAYTLYDLYVCPDPVASQTCKTDANGKPTGGDWMPIISETQYVRLDNVSSAWIKLGQLNPAKELKVVQSYHLSSWPNAPEPDVTNWAQGDVMTFNIDLMATQLNAPGPKGALATLKMDNKDPVTWVPIADNIAGTLTYNTSGSTFNYNFTGTVPQANTDYCLIYYADPWPGQGKTNNAGMDIACGTSAPGTGILSLSGNYDIGTDLPNPDDQNFPAGAKLQVVLDADYDNVSRNMTDWNPANYLFEMNLIQYDEI